MNWTIILNFLTALAIIPPILKWCFIKGYRIDLRRKDFEKISTHLSNYIKNTYQQKLSKEPAELQTETNILLADDRTNYLLIFYALDKKLNDLFSFLKDIKHAGIFLKIDYHKEPIEFKSRLTKRTINRLFIISFSLHLIAILFWAFFYLIDLSPIFGMKTHTLTLSFLCFTAFFISISTKAKTIEFLSKKIPINFPN